MTLEMSMEQPPTNGLILDMAGNGEKYGNKAVAYRLELTRLALGYRSKTDFCAAVPGLKTDMWFNYTGSANTAPRDRIPVDMAAAICHAFPDVTMDWIYLGSRETLKVRMVEALDTAERALQSHSKLRRARKGR